MKRVRHGDEGLASCGGERAVQSECTGGEVPHRRGVRGGDRISSQARDACASCQPVQQTFRATALAAIYGGVEREALIILWEASDRVCGKR